MASWGTLFSTCVCIKLFHTLALTTFKIGEKAESSEASCLFKLGKLQVKPQEGLTENLIIPWWQDAAHTAPQVQAHMTWIKLSLRTRKSV